MFRRQAFAAGAARALAAAVLSSALSVLVPSPSSAVPPDWVAAWNADLAFAADTLPKVHPNLFHSISRDDFRAELDGLAARLADLDHDAITVELARIVARIGDGHTRLTLPFDSAAGVFTGHSRTAPPRIPGLVFRRLPVRFGLFEDELFVVAATAEHRELLGARVLEVGERPLDAAMAAVEPTIQRDNASQVRGLMPTWLGVPEILHARGVSASREVVRLVVATDRGRRREVKLATVPAGQGGEWLDVRGDARARADREPEHDHWFERLEGDVIYARYRQVQDQAERTIVDFSAAIGREFSAADARALILDVRGNPGGDGSQNRPLVRAILSSPALFEPGALFVLEDGGTFSAATMLLAELERYAGPVLVGEKSGGAPNGYGDSRRVRLPNTGLTIRASTLYWQTTDPRDERDGFAPLVAIEPRFAPWRRGGDAALDSALTLARGGGDVAGRWKGHVSLGRQGFDVEFDVGSGATPEVRMTAEDIGMSAAAARGTSRSGDRVEFTLDSPFGPLRGAARAAGNTLVGRFLFQGSPVPFVAARVPAGR